jgi:aspartyl-tRNA(Asn)/glutamyl-tRNA(Gln) amidotransferase subunit A
MFCGVIGLTPTYGLVSRYGLIDYANSLDKIGPLGKSTIDVAAALNVMSGYDERDQTSLKVKKRDYTKFEKVKGYKIGLPREYFKNVSKSVEKRVHEGIRVLEGLGVKFVDVSLSMTKYVLPAYYLAALSEASTNLARYDGVRFGAGLKSFTTGNYNDYYSKVRSKLFGAEAKRRIILGTFARMSGYRNQYYLRAMKVRTLIINDFKKVFKKVDCLLSPTMMFTAPRFDEIKKLDPLQEYQSDLLTCGPNLAGIPMINVPCGADKNGLPVGFHVISDHLKELKVLSVSHAYEEATK